MGASLVLCPSDGAATTEWTGDGVFKNRGEPARRVAALRIERGYELGGEKSDAGALRRHEENPDTIATVALDDGTTVPQSGSQTTSLFTFQQRPSPCFVVDGTH